MNDIYIALVQCQQGSFNIFNLSLLQVESLKEAYNRGDPAITFRGQSYTLKNLRTLKIYKYNISDQPFEKVLSYFLENINFASTGLNGSYLKHEVLIKFSNDITDDIIGDIPYGGTATLKDNRETYFIDQSRIYELKQIKSEKFDLSKLIQICQELNSNYANGNYFSVGLLVRTILNHIPPIFCCKTFEQYVSQCNKRSHKKSMENLQLSLRNIADSYTHDLIQEKEVLPTKAQIEFRPDLDVLISEIIRVFKT